MDIPCSQCGNLSGPYEDLVWMYQGIQLMDFKSGMVCARCQKQTIEELFDEFAAQLITRTGDGSFTVNWKWYARAHSRSHWNDDDRRKMNELLFALGVFSYHAEGNWAIVSVQQVQMHPVHAAFFTQREYAEGYARQELSTTLYGWEIRHISEVISDKDVLAQGSAVS